MSDALEQASLIMVPSGYENGTLGSLKPLDGTGDFTFSRGSDISATRVNADGYIEKGYENLTYPSNDFSGWSKVELDLTPNQADPFGGNTATLITTTGTTFGWIRRVPTNTGVQTISFYAKAGSNTIFTASIIQAPYPQVKFTLTGDGSTSSNSVPIDSTITLIGDGWYRCSMTYNLTSTYEIRFYPNDTINETIGDSAYIYGFQLNQGLVAYPYVETTTAPVAGGILEDMPRLDYTDSSCPALLLEPERTNLAFNSETFGSGVGSVYMNANIDVTYTPNYGISPEGVKNSTRVQFNDSTAFSYRGVSLSGDNTGSLYVKGTVGEDIRFGFGTNVTNGGTIHTFDGTWQRVTHTSSTGVQFYLSNYTYTGNQASDFEIYGLQHEVGSYPTSYIPTYGRIQTRLRDVVIGAGDVNTFNSTEGVLYAEFNALADDRGESGFFQISDGTGNNRFLIGNSSAIDSRIGSVCVIGGALQWNINSSSNFDVTQFHKVALSYKENDITLYVDGEIQGTDTSAIMAPANTFNVLDFRANVTTSRYGEVKQVLYFPTALSDDECIALTTIS